jgi:hypothetical protein
MRVVQMDQDEVTVHLSRQEVFRLMYFVITARGELACASAEGAAIDRGFRALAAEFSQALVAQSA